MVTGHPSTRAVNSDSGNRVKLVCKRGVSYGTNESEAVREPTGNVCGTVVDNGNAHAGERRLRAHHTVSVLRSNLDRVVIVVRGSGDRHVISGHVEQTRDAELGETGPSRGVPAASQVQPGQQLNRIAALYVQTQYTVHIHDFRSVSTTRVDGPS